MKRRLALLALWMLCQIAALLTALRMFWAIFTAPDRAWQIALAYDRMSNAAANDDAVQTVSSRAYFAQQAGKRWGCVLCRFLDLFEREHCRKAVD